MKKIRTYIFAIIAMAFTAFVVGNNSVKAKNDVVLNPNTNGEPSNVHEVYLPSEEETEGELKSWKKTKKQYTTTRDVSFKVIIDETLDRLYDEKFKACEVITVKGTGKNAVDTTEERCSEFSFEDDIHYMQLTSKGDGDKKILIKLNYKTIGYGGKYTVDGTEKVEKQITLDTTGPNIDLTGGEYIYIPRGEKYEEQKATCTDDSDLFDLDYKCKVEIEEAQIDMSKEGFQYVKYTAKDFLGNDTNVLRKVMVEVVVADEGIDLYWFFAIGVFVIVALFLTYKVVKNKDKQKNQSVL